MALMGNLQEPFTGTAAPTGWSAFASADGTSFTYASTGVTVNLPATTSGSTDGDISYSVLDLTGSFARLNVTSVTAVTASHTDNLLRLKLDGSNNVQIFVEGTGSANNIFFAKTIGGSQTNIASIAYDPVAHAQWQIRHKGATVYYETSSDGVTWTTRAIAATPFAITALIPIIGAISFGIDVAPGSFSFRYFNYPQRGTTTSTSSTSVSTTSTSISSTSTSISTTSSSTSSTSQSISTSSTSSSLSSTSSSISTTSSSTSSTSSSSTSSSTSFSSTSSSISSTSLSSTSQSSTSSSTSQSTTSTSFSSTSSSISSTSSSTSSTSFSSTSSSSSTSTTTVPPPYYDFTYADRASLVTNNIDLNSETAVQYSNQLGDDGDYLIQTGAKYLIQQFKDLHQNNIDNPFFTWKGRSTISTISSPILVQIYNVNSAAWELLGIINTVRADTDTSITVAQTTNVSNYYDTRNIITFRLYQQVN